MWLKCFSAAARTTLDTAFDAHAAGGYAGAATDWAKLLWSKS
jgi:hypothetical protein